MRPDEPRAFDDLGACARFFSERHSIRTPEGCRLCTLGLLALTGCFAVAGAR